jgi:t-SNARE complex subunit (syntaxin)
MIKDEYEILAFNDLNVAMGYLSTINKVLDSLREDKSPLLRDAEDAYIGIVMFTEKYRHRLEDFSSIRGQIEKARNKHRTLIAKEQEGQKKISELTKQLENSRELCLDLQYDNEKLKAFIIELQK